MRLKERVSYVAKSTRSAEILMSRARLIDEMEGGRSRCGAKSNEANESNESRALSVCTRASMSARIGRLISKSRVLLSVCAGAYVAALLCMATPHLSGQSGSAGYPSFQAGDYGQAIRVARRELIDTPNNIDARIVLSWSLLALGQHQNALGVALEAYNIVPDDARFSAVIGESYYQLGDYLEALPFLERYTTLLPNGIAIARVNSIMGEIFIQFGEYHHAIAAFAGAVHFDPAVAQWWQRLGVVYEQVGESELAAEAYGEAQRLIAAQR